MDRLLAHRQKNGGLDIVSSPALYRLAFTVESGRREVRFRPEPSDGLHALPGTDMTGRQGVSLRPNYRFR